MKGYPPHNIQNHDGKDACQLNDYARQKLLDESYDLEVHQKTPHEILAIQLK